MHKQFNPYLRNHEDRAVKLTKFALALIFCASQWDLGLTQAAELEDLLDDVHNESLNSAESASGTTAEIPGGAASDHSDQFTTKDVPSQEAEVNIETEIGDKEKLTAMDEKEALPALRPTRYGVGYEYRMNRAQRPERGQRPERAQRPGR